MGRAADGGGETFPETFLLFTVLFTANLLSRFARRRHPGILHGLGLFQGVPILIEVDALLFLVFISTGEIIDFVNHATTSKKTDESLGFRRGIRPV